MKARHKAALIGIAIALYSTAASADLTNQGMFDQVMMEFASRAARWQTEVMNAAMFLFWTLGTISLVWTFGFMALRKADIGEFFAELIRFILFFGFFLWLLRNGPAFASSIIESLARIGEQASGVAAVTPSGIVDVGFLIFKQAISSLSLLNVVDSVVGFVLSLAILLLLATIGVNMLLLYVSAWILMYAGVFFLGFGGSRWTSDMAINYYKTVLGIAVQIFAMVLLIGIGNDLLSSFYGKMNVDEQNFEELGVMLVFCLALLMLVHRVPPLVAGIITGSSIGGGGIGNFGTGAVVGAAVGAGAAAATGGAALAAGGIAAGVSAGGGAQALMAAVQAGQANVSAGTDIMGGFQGMSDSAGSFADAAGYGSGSSAATAGNTPFAQAGGYSSSGGGQSMAAKGGGGQPQANQAAGSGTRAASGSGTDAAPTPQAVADGGADGGTDAAPTPQAAADGGADGGTDAAPGTQAQRGASSLTAATAGRIAVDAAANLAKGIGDVARQKAASLGASANQRLRQTTGGKIADAIHARSHADHQPPLTFGGNSLGGAEEVDPIAEVAAFANRDSGKKGA
jgi:type IV secretion system protein TrbL